MSEKSDKERIFVLGMMDFGKKNVLQTQLPVKETCCNSQHEYRRINSV